ncbi:MAG: hypothetical protein RR551_06450, partial [Mucinivorans sp.]
ELDCTDNNLTQLDVSKNTRLTWLYCANNKLTQLDVSKNTRLNQLHCFNNRMSALNITTFTNFIAYPNLQCGEQKQTDGTTLQPLTLTVTQQQMTDGLGTWFENNAGVTPTLK